MKKPVYYLMILLFIIGSCTSSKRKEQTISISGAFALYPLVVQWAEAYKQDHPGTRFNISAGGAGKGMADALSGTVDLGMFSREIAEEEIDKGVWWVGLAIDAVLPTISEQNTHLGSLKARGMSRDELKAVFIDGTITDWNYFDPKGEESPIEVYCRSDACGAAGTWAEYLGGKQENINGIGIYGDPGLAEAVASDPRGIGFNNTIFIYDINTGIKRPGIEVIPSDLNANHQLDPGEDFYDTFDQVLAAIAGGYYPAPPARELYFVARGKPQKKACLEFIEWALTKGQAYVKPAGYVPVEEDKIREYIEQLK
ncbi:MAG: substrate-binding domain-containing protein [Bacteroidales bacterium]|jgi:phosphate transport system substrate-binding protein|nr:substrate-binding domain-containing protein [Bacteroidales bacterium]